MDESRQSSPRRNSIENVHTPARSYEQGHHVNSKSAPRLPKKPSPVLSPGKLQRLCRSLIANKLHIPSHDLPEQYVISIPFKLQMPPKLCANTDDDECSLTLLSTARLSQPSRSSKSSHSNHDFHAGTQFLYFDGRSYALFDKHENELPRDQQQGDSEFENFIQRPPYPTNELALGLPDQSDTLSVIDEVSLCESRHASVRKSGLTTLPSLRMKGIERASHANEGVMHDFERTSGIPETVLENEKAPQSRQSDSPSPILLEPISPHPIGMYSPLKFELNYPSMKTPARRKPPPVDFQDHSPYTPTSTNSPNPFIDGRALPTPETCSEGLQSQNSANHVNHLHPEFKSIHMDLSTHSHMVEADNLTSPPHSGSIQLEKPAEIPYYELTRLLTEKQRAEQRQVSSSSGASFSSQGTDDSLQNSVDLRLSPSRGSLSRTASTSASDRELESESAPERNLKLEPALELASELELDLGQDQKDVTEEAEASTEPLHLSSITSANYNRGSGMKFSFPNNDLNITNTAPIQPEFKASASRRQSFVLPNGQIEIPDCDDGWSMGAAVNFDSSNTTQQFTRHTKSKSTPIISTLARITPSPKRSSPVRHQRHKSMHSIAYGVADFAAPEPSSFKFGVGSSAQQTNESDANDYVVEEPPARVSYPVDFKEHEPHYQSNSVKSSSRSDSNYSHSGRIIPPPAIRTPRHAYARMGAASSCSEQSYGSFSALKSTSSISDVSNVMIDLTKGNYDVCTINRTDSVLSYKSVTERDRSGKEVEVVLVDEDNDTDHDELLSIYSKYNNDEWIQRKGHGASPNSSSSSSTSRLSKSHMITPQRPMRSATSRKPTLAADSEHRPFRPILQERATAHSTNNRMINRLPQDSKQSMNADGSVEGPCSTFRVGRLKVFQPATNDPPAKQNLPGTASMIQRQNHIQGFDHGNRKRIDAASNRASTQNDYLALLTQYTHQQVTPSNIADMDDYDFSSYQ